MTLTDLEENACCKTMQPLDEPESGGGDSLDLGLALRETVWQALEQDRLRVGVVECTQLLEIDPFNVMMCVMPVTALDDVTAIIQRTLIEAFCREYDIRLIKIDSVTKLCKMLQGRSLSQGTSPPSEQTQQSSPRVAKCVADTSCVLIQYPEGGESSEEEERVAQHCKASPVNDHNTVIALPD